MKRAAGHEVRKTIAKKNAEWRKLGESLQGDYVNNQRKFWTSIQSAVKVTKMCEETVIMMDRYCVTKKR